MTSDNSGPVGELPKGAGSRTENHGIIVWIHPFGKAQLPGPAQGRFSMELSLFLHA